MRVDINISKFGDYGLLFVDLCCALAKGEHDVIAAVLDRMLQLARQKTLDHKATAEGVVKP